MSSTARSEMDVIVQAIVIEAVRRESAQTTKRSGNEDLRAMGGRLGIQIR